MKYIGAHVSIAGGVENAPLNAAAIGATAFAMFTKNQRQWSSPPLEERSIAAFQKNLRSSEVAPEHVLPHDGYLINLAQPDPVKRKNAVAAFTDELRRCRELGLPQLNFHPGSTLGKVSVEAGLELVAAGVREALSQVPEVMAVFENTAGQGSCLGGDFSGLARLLEMTGEPERIGVCLDTCHAFAAGYDLSSAAGREEAFSEFEETIGFRRLRGMHLNDAQGICGGHLDRHAPLGEGALGWECFEALMADDRFDGIPLVLETPLAERWPEEIARLRRMSRR